MKQSKQEPKDAVTAGEQFTISTGPTDESQPLGLKLTTSATARSVEIKLQPQVKLKGEEPKLYRRKEMQRQGVVKACGNTVIRQKGPKLVAPGRLNRIKMIHMPSPGRFAVR